MTHLDHLDFQSAHSFSRGENKNLEVTKFCKNTCEQSLFLAGRVLVFPWFHLPHKLKLVSSGPNH